MTTRELAKATRKELHGRSETFKGGTKQTLFFFLSAIICLIVYNAKGESIAWAGFTAFCCWLAWNSYRNHVLRIAAIEEKNAAIDFVLSVKQSATIAAALADEDEETEADEIPFIIEGKEIDPPVMGNDESHDVYWQKSKPAKIGFQMSKAKPEAVKGRPKGVKRRLPESYAEWCNRLDFDRGGAKHPKT